jgi:monomeric isocitrate dehydrogenase
MGETIRQILVEEDLRLAEIVLIAQTGTPDIDIDHWIILAVERRDAHGMATIWVEYVEPWSNEIKTVNQTIETPKLDSILESTARM